MHCVDNLRTVIQITLTHHTRHPIRLFQTRHQYLYSPQRNILDGELLWRYPQLSSKEKTDFAKQIGTTQAQILEDLKEMDKVSAHF